ncbi:hypothetical protein Acr_00g0046770 [Actinidia rufa]|uniref:Serine-threonine/tyrosine-protein kinase catalytic domain-containing protein n=1 Tax=Actinidia rufa TaxID=165716 RepID=A0A7J0DJS2_9ERIC|nr:hypothetical protein Acr_00g0046770 [Actinidia rufa]
MKIGQEGDPKPSFSPTRNPAVRDEQSEFGGSETLEIARHSHEVIQRSKKDEQMPGWPLLYTSSEPVTSTGKGSQKNVGGAVGAALPDGKPVAVKVLKSCKEAWKDFTREVDIMNSLKHKNITPLVGVCVEDNALMSVSDFLSRGNQEDNYTLSDFGLAIRGPTGSLFVTDNDVGVNCKPINSETAKLGPVGGPNIARLPSYEVPSPHLERQTLSPNPLDRGKTSPRNLAKSSPLSSPEPPSEYSSDRPESKYCLLLALGRGRVLRIAISRLHLQTLHLHQNPLYTWKLPLARFSLFFTTPTIAGYSPDGNLSNYVSYISEISFHTHPSEDLAVIRGHGSLLTPFIKRPLPHHLKRPRPGPLLLFVCAGRPLSIQGPVPRRPSNIDYWLLAQISTTTICKWPANTSLSLFVFLTRIPGFSSLAENSLCKTILDDMKFLWLWLGIKLKQKFSP